MITNDGYTFGLPKDKLNLHDKSIQILSLDKIMEVGTLLTFSTCSNYISLLINLLCYIYV